MNPADLLAKHGIKIESTAPGRHYTTCPKCSAARSTKEHRAAKVLGVTIENDGSVYFGCNHCDFTGPKKGDGKRADAFEATYDFHSKDGTLLFQKVRNRPGASSRFLCRRLEGGIWVWGLSKKIERPLYRLPEITEAIKEGRTILVVEGEKDADACWRVGFPATCNFDGASELGKKPKWRREYSETFRDADIVVLNDNDAAGYAHADAAAKLSLGIAKRVRRLDLAKHWPDMPKGGDVSDWLAAGHTGEELAKLVEAAPDYVPPEGPKAEASPASGTAADDDAELERLARMSPLEYERARKEAGKRLGISRLSTLDLMVKGKRAELGLDAQDDTKAGRPIAFPEHEPWPEPVDGAALLDELVETIGGHVVMLDHFSHAGALWSLHTHLIDKLSITPRLAIYSPTKRCGKTTLLDVLGHLVRRPKMAADISPSAIFRVVEAHRPTLLIDEGDTFLPGNDDMRRLLNSGYQRNGTVIRNVGESSNYEPREFSTYAPCAIASIGRLHATVQDRSVRIDLKPKKASEKIKPFRFDRTEHLDILARKAARWAADNDEGIRNAEPEMPDGVFNREADNWMPLLAIADLAGGEWPKRAREALMKNRGDEGEDGSRLELLLGDIRDVFINRSIIRISSAELIENLVEIVPRPWAEYGKSGKPITQNKLARLLKPLAIPPTHGLVILMDGSEANVRRYELWQFKEAFERFLLPPGGAQLAKWQKLDEMATSEHSKVATPAQALPVGKSQKSSNGGLFATLPVGKGGAGANSAVCSHCGRPGGNRVAFDGGEVILHRECENPWIDTRMREEGIS